MACDLAWELSKERPCYESNRVRPGAQLLLTQLHEAFVQLSFFVILSSPSLDAVCAVASPAPHSRTM